MCDLSEAHSFGQSVSLPSFPSFAPQTFYFVLLTPLTFETSQGNILLKICPTAALSSPPLYKLVCRKDSERWQLEDLLQKAFCLTPYLVGGPSPEGGSCLSGNNDGDSSKKGACGWWWPGFCSHCSVEPLTNHR